MTASRYTRHLEILRSRYDEALQANGFDGALIGAGLPVPVFRDDQHYPWRAEPLLAQWLPLLAHPGSCLLYRPGRRPRVLVLEEPDFWHQPAPVPEGPWLQSLDVRVVASRRELNRQVPARGTLALLGEPRQWQDLPRAMGSGRRNPARLLRHLDYRRAIKTPWEVDAHRRATALALAGHRAVREAWARNLSEFELGLVFAAACGQMDHELPYPAIIASNRNAATLHYQHRERLRPRGRDRHSLLMDAGCAARGYASDITRTHAARRGGFADLLSAVDELQQELCDRVRPGVQFGELQLEAHHGIGRVLREAGLVRLRPEDQVERGITAAFFPHGLGHLLGLNVHDVGGDLGPRGRRLRAPTRFPRLRLLRRLEVGMVLTIEPGLYFIESLLARLRSTRAGRQVNWRALEALRPFGGIRIEDNVLVTAGGHENLTRSMSGGS